MPVRPDTLAPEETNVGPTIGDVIAAIEPWRGRAVVAEPIRSGLTNHNYRVEIDGSPVFVRIPGSGTDLLAVDRANELANTMAAAQAGVGPRVLQHLPGWDVLVLEWIEGQTMSNEAFDGDDQPGRIADTLRRLHGGPRFRDDFDMFRTAERYRDVVDARGIAIPVGYREHMPRIPAIESALAVHPMPTVPCHNDLLADNYLDDGTRLWIVDYEYSGNNDPTFELGNTCQELGWDDDRIERLCAAYFGHASDGLLARMRLQMIMSDVGWTLWASIQSSISTIDFDFAGWADERWARAQTAIDGPDFDGWLEAVS
jgi:thiamine kinase-like enzyme